MSPLHLERGSQGCRWSRHIAILSQANLPLGAAVFAKSIWMKARAGYGSHFFNLSNVKDCLRG